MIGGGRVALVGCGSKQDELTALRCTRITVREQSPPNLFADNDKYKLLAKKVWPVLANCREQLLDCYDTENGRPGAGGVVMDLALSVFGEGARTGKPWS